jgi:hypothetical protein
VRVAVCGSQRITYIQEWDVANRLAAVTTKALYNEPS